jgi:hypothetical protein
MDWVDAQNNFYFTIYEGFELKEKEIFPTYLNLCIQIPINSLNNLDHFRLFIKKNEKIALVHDLGDSITFLMIKSLQTLKLDEFEVFKKVIGLLPKLKEFKGKTNKVPEKFKMEEFLTEIKFDEFKSVSIKNLVRPMTISRVARKTTGKGFYETLNVDDLFEEPKKGRWSSKINKNYFTIYEGIEVGDTKKNTLYSSINVCIEVPITLLHYMNHIRLFLKCGNKRHFIYDSSGTIIKELIQKLKELKLDVFPVFRTVIDLLPFNSKVSPKKSEGVLKLQSFLKVIQFDEFKNISIKESSKDDSDLLLIDDGDIFDFSPSNEDFGPEEIKKSKSSKIHTNLSENFFLFLKGTELETSKQEIKLENIFILVPNVTPIEDINYLIFYVSFEGFYSEIDISELILFD